MFKYIPKSLRKPFARSLVRIPKPILRMMVGKTSMIDGQVVDLHCQYLGKYFGFSEKQLKNVDGIRNEYEITGGLLGHDVVKGSKVIPFQLRGEADPIQCELYQPSKLLELPSPALIYFHGGGHVIGSLNTHRAICRQLAEEAECLVIAVDYRLAPENPFPAGINDALQVFDQLTEKADEFDINPKRIAIGGESAGGNIAAVVAQQRRDIKNPPCFQLLIVPWMDMSRQTRSYHLFESGFQLDKRLMEWYTNHYLGSNENGLDPMASPLLGDVNDVCTAAVIVAGFDPLRDEGLAYGNKLREAGIKTQIHCFSELIHTYMNIAGYIPAARKAFEETARILKVEIHNS